MRLIHARSRPAQIDGLIMRPCRPRRAAFKIGPFVLSKDNNFPLQEKYVKTKYNVILYSKITSNINKVYKKIFLKSVA